MSYFPRATVTRHWPLLLVGALALDLLSTGPAVVFMSRSHALDTVFHFLYKPLALFPDFARPALNAYVDWWLEITRGDNTTQ